MFLRNSKQKNKATKDKLAKENHQKFNKIVEYERKWGKMERLSLYNEQNEDKIKRNRQEKK